MNNENIESKLVRLGYTESWLLFNVLTSGILEKQLSELDKGEDTNEEHYRYKTFCSYLELQTSLSNKLVDHLISLLLGDADKSMVASASIRLLKHQYLTDEQFNKVKLLVRGFGEWADIQITKAELKRLKK
ncbi:MAG: hypothetical protein GXC73_18760 [Chitinophagaceae bacterium]|nr:hypothetical protein [Chitinophagaceae bacterium]